MKFPATIALLVVSLPGFGQVPNIVDDYFRNQIKPPAAETVPKVSRVAVVKILRDDAFAQLAQQGIAIEPELVELWETRLRLASWVDDGKMSLEFAKQLDKAAVDSFARSVTLRAAQKDSAQRERVMAEEQAQMARQRAAESASSGRGFLELGLGILRANNPPPAPQVNCTTQYVGRSAYTTCR